MRITIERLRWTVLAAAVLLLVALAAILAIGRWRNPFNRRDLPQKLGLNIQQEANGWTYTHGSRGQTLYKIHAARLVQMKQGKHVLLHDVMIELYGADGARVDRIEGAEFEYDPEGSTVKATGPVEITLMRPGVAPAVAPKAATEAIPGKLKPLAAAARSAASGEVHVKTNGLDFDQQSGMATAPNRVEFSLKQGSGSAMGARYDSQQSTLTLERAVELKTQRGGEAVDIHAGHAEFERGDQFCRLQQATAAYRNGTAAAGEAKILFRNDGTAERLDATAGFTLNTAAGGRLNAPSGQLLFNQRNQPSHGHLQGGVAMDSAGEGRLVHGASPTAELEFGPQGALRRAHFQQGLELATEQRSEAQGVALRVSRMWRSPVADVEFRESGHGQTQASSLHGSGGVLVTGESQRGAGPVEPFRLAADEVNGQFGKGSQLTALTGTGHASLQDTTAAGARRTTSGDRLEATFESGAATGPKGGVRRVERGVGGDQQIQSATIDGHVVLVQSQASKSSADPAGQMRATAGRAVYEGAGDWLHLTVNPRIEDGALQLAADKIDFSQSSGDAFAHGNVKASWLGAEEGKGAQGRQGEASLGGQGPVHAVSAEGQLRQVSGEVTFRGQARLWQQGNSIAAPAIVLDRIRQTLVARSADAAEPVRTVLVSAPASELGGRQQQPQVIRLHGGDLKYSGVERKALMRGGALGTVTAETGTAVSVSNEVEVSLLPAGGRTRREGAQAQLDRITARGRVTLTSLGRRGTGEQLAYNGATAEYVLTGTSAAPPRMNDPARGVVTGEALIFNSRDDSVRVEGGGRKTATETTAPR